MPLSSGKHKDNELLHQFLDVDGDGTGITTGKGDFSSVSRTLFIQPPDGVIYKINCFVAHISDAGKFGLAEYGNLGSALTNGVIFKKVDDSGDIFDFTSNQPIKTNDEWLHISASAALQDWEGTDNSLHVVIEFKKQYTDFLYLDGSKNERLEVILNDNFTNLLDQHFVIFGVK